MSRLVHLLVAISVYSTPALAVEGFLTDIKTAYAKAASEQKPLLVDFQTSWCVACRQMEKTTWKDESVTRLMERFVTLTVDGDRDKNLVARYRVDVYPTVVIASASGEAILVLTGLQDEKAMSGHLQSSLDRLEQLSAWADMTGERRPDPEALLGLAEFAAARGAHGRAEQLFRKVWRKKRELDDRLVTRAGVGLGASLIALGECRDGQKTLKKLPAAAGAELDSRRRQLAAINCDR